VVGALSLEVFEPLLGLVKGLPMLLAEGCDVCPLLGSLARWKILAEKCLGKNLPGSERVGLLVLQPVTGSIL